MKIVLRFFLLTLVICAAFGGNLTAKSHVAPFAPSSVPGGGGPMPTCDPFKNPDCPVIR